MDKKLKWARGNTTQQKLIRLIAAIIIIVVTAIVITIFVNNKANEVKQNFNMPNINTDQFKDDLQNNINNTAEDISNKINQGIQNFFNN